jgi:PAS domain S-box-containing protein
VRGGGLSSRRLPRRVERDDDMLQDFIDQAAYFAHGYCLIWNPWLVTLHAGSDVLISLAYFAIPIAIWIFVRRRPDLELRFLARLFAAFIFWCGMTHVFNIITLWYPIYESQGVVKGITALVSVATAILIFPLIPRALSIPSPRQLQGEVDRHRHTLTELEQTKAELELRVEARTRELREATERFRSLFHRAPVAMVMVDRKGRLQQMNEAAETLFGYSETELVGREVETLLPGSHRADHEKLRDAYCEDPSARPMGAGRELFGLRKSGEEVPVEIGLNPILSGGGVAVVASVIDISARRQAEERMRVVMRELSHRSKNLLALIQAMAHRVASFAPDMKTFEGNFNERLQGLARSHELLVSQDWQGALLEELVHSQLDFAKGGESHTVAAEGPRVLLTPAATQNIGMALHELATNAVKHGALSREGGGVRVTWAVSGNKAESRLTLRWQEFGVPGVQPGGSKGFGSTVLESIVPQSLDGGARFDIGPDGINWVLWAPLQNVMVGVAATT